MSFDVSASLVVAYAGTAAGVGSVLPAAQRLSEFKSAPALTLLWPDDVPCEPRLYRLVPRRIVYPVMHADSRGLRGAVEALRDVRAEGAFVFTESGWAADVPAYIAYLAGIRRRFGFAAEFTGGLLSDSAAEPPSHEPNRHLYLLRLHGLATRASPPGLEPASTQGGAACAR